MATLYIFTGTVTLVADIIETINVVCVCRAYIFLFNQYMNQKVVKSKHSPMIMENFLGVYDRCFCIHITISFIAVKTSVNLKYTRVNGSYDQNEPCNVRFLCNVSFNFVPFN